MTEPVWLPRATVELIHDRQIAAHGGLRGVRDPGLLDSAMMRAPNAWTYGEADLAVLASYYAEGVAKNHPFSDGNKRTAFVAAALFLRINGRPFRATQAEVLGMTLGLASGQLPREGFANWLRDRSA